MQVSLRLGEHGWSELDLWMGEDHRNFCITHIFNCPLTAVAEAMLSLLEGDNEVIFTLHEEPGQHVWTATQIPEEQHLLLVEIRSHEDNMRLSKPADDISEFRVARTFFIESFVRELDKISFQLKCPRFARDRSAEEFPWKLLDEIRRKKQNRSEQEVPAKSDRSGG